MIFCAGVTKKKLFNFFYAGVTKNIIKKMNFLFFFYAGVSKSFFFMLGSQKILEILMLGFQSFLYKFFFFHCYLCWGY